MSNLRARQSAAMVRGALCCIIALAFIFGGAGAAHAEGQALRAPLNIIPPALQSNDKARPSTAPKLEPRTIARQSNRAHRAIAALPNPAGQGAAGQVVQVGQLGALQDAAIGLEKGYGSAVWRGARLAYVAPLLARLPPTHRYHALRRMELRLHRSQAAAPSGTVQGTSWFAARLNRFLALGDTQSVIDLVALTGAERSDAYVLQALARAYLGAGKRHQACALPAPKRGMAGRRATRQFFLQLLIYCQLASESFAKAALSLELNQKTLADVALFRDLAFLLAAKEQPQAVPQALAERHAQLPATLDVLEFALLRLAGIAIPDTTILPPFLHYVIRNDETLAPRLRIKAAYNARIAGVLSAQDYVLFARQFDLDGFTRVALPSLPPAHARATYLDAPLAAILAVQWLAAAPLSDHPYLVAYVLAEAAKEDYWHDMVIALAPFLRALPPPQDAPPQAAPQFFAVPFFSTARTSPPPRALTPEAATYIAAAHIVLGEDDAAKNWLAVSNQPPLLRLATQPPNIFAPQQVAAHPPLEARAHIDWDALLAELAEPAEAGYRAYLHQEIALRHGLGAPLPSTLSSTLKPEAIAAQQTPFAHFVKDRRIGDLILSLIAAYADKLPHDITPEAAAALMATFISAGLGDDAQTLAREILVRHYVYRYARDKL